MPGSLTERTLAVFSHESDRALTLVMLLKSCAYAVISTWIRTAFCL